ncbi:dynamin family protein [Bacillus canaveralius]|uniref:dynamin family protein n=1 Tax=Bacillus canaveralius TaxID=1403243 RepID=UPI000F78792F|nr:dynamin family protein [Bacillus canaveralius]RSK53750.1 Dynamin family protein [Bacillus canaveralius]
MVQIVNQEQELFSKIAALYSYFIENNDEKTAEKARQIAWKLHKQEFSISFCGHFSAGKSTMINRLIGEELLPSSPIPTSANLVKIKAGEDFAKVYFKFDHPHLYPAPYDYEQVKSYCKDGDQIESIEFSSSKAPFPQEAVIMDTPGIDSTDDAHRIATESALHLADIVFYVMDYNHVQSEVNFMFTKQLTDAGKQVYLVINQIDKHQETELAFSEFSQSVHTAFASWGVTPAKIFFTSLKNDSEPHNQFSELQHFLFEKISKRDKLLPGTIFESLKKLAEDHFQLMAAEDEEQLEELDRLLLSVPEENSATLLQKTADLLQEIELLDSSIELAAAKIVNETEAILKNAYLMPFQTRELAECYLQSRQSDFKIGILFSRQKTEQARAERLSAFFNDLQEKVKSQLEWHLKEMLLKMIKEKSIHDPELEHAAQTISIQFDEKLLGETVKPGAGVTGDYLLNYTEDLANALKKLARDQVLKMKEQIVLVLQQKSAANKAVLLAEHKELEAYLEAATKREAIFKSQTSIKFNLEKLLSGDDFDSQPISARIKELLSPDADIPKIIRNSDKQVCPEKTKSRKERPHGAVLLPEKDIAAASDRRSRLTSALRHASAQITDVPGLLKLSEDLMEKAFRLENKNFTVALFGAFSAGKSSFANALLGESILPVSPNPTTAAINKIKPVTTDEVHGIVNVKLKDAEALFYDVNRSLHFFDMKAADFEDALLLIGRLLTKETFNEAAEKTHLAFLTAFYKGFNEYADQLGTVIKTDLHEFRDFVAIEQKSCLVEWVDVFYDCPLTRAGITLVDTPGADSINARHTGVAFDYIKNSDVILFVTYYNHAFSKADREFLIQLGRVKETFQLDKMFFAVNAIDLAANEAEMDDVIGYVNEQLIQHGIRQPSLFALSSLLALREKQQEEPGANSRMPIFEQAFYSFIANDLTEMAEAAATADLTRTAKILDKLISASLEDKEAKNQQRIAISSEKRKLLDRIRSQSAEVLLNRLNQETDELAFYIKQRVFFRFNDFFKEAFNPSLLKDDGRNLKKAVDTALEDLLDSLGFDFAQEMRATGLRIEAYIRNITSGFYSAFTTELASANRGLSYSTLDAFEFESIEFQSAFKDIDRQLFKKATAYFKNPKAFFEKNEKRLMSEELERALHQPADHYIKLQGARLKEHYSRLLSDLFTTMLASITRQTEDFYDGILAALNDGYPVDALKKKAEEIEFFRVKDEENGKLAGGA